MRKPEPIYVPCPPGKTEMAWCNSNADWLDAPASVTVEYIDYDRPSDAKHLRRLSKWLLKAADWLEEQQ